MSSPEDVHLDLVFGELRKQGIYSEGKKLPLNIRDARNALAELRTDGQYVIRTLEKEKKDNTEQNVIEAKELWFRYEKNAPDILRSMDFQLKKAKYLHCWAAMEPEKVLF